MPLPAAPVALQADDATPVSTLTFAAIAGTPSAAQEVHFWNAQGAGSGPTIPNGRISCKVEFPRGSGLYVFSGAQAVDEGWLQAQEIGVEGAAIDAPTAWTSIGGSSWLPVPDLPFNSAVKVRFRMFLPQDPGLDAVTEKFIIVYESAVSYSISAGFSESAGPDAVLGGIGDGTYTAQLLGGDATESGTVDSTYEVPYLAWISAGIPWAHAAHQETVNDQDSAAIHLASGESYILLLTGAPSGALVTTKGVKASTGSAVAPAIPAGHVPLYKITRNFDGLIHNSEIAQIYTLGRFAASSSGFIFSMGPGWARVDNAILRNSQATLCTLVASSTNSIWLTRAGNAAATQDGSRPEARALLMYEADTDGAGVSAIRDKRLINGGDHQRIRFGFAGGLVANAVDQDLNAGHRTRYIDPERVGGLALDDLGVSPTSDETRFNIRYSDAGGGYVSIFPDNASMFRIGFAATNPVTMDCKPTILAIPAGARLQAYTSAVVTATTAPGGAEVALNLIVT